MNGQHLDLSSDPGVASSRRAEADGARYLGVHFICCDAYARIYPNQAGTAYIGHCPRCAKRVEFKVGAGGTDARFFTVQ